MKPKTFNIVMCCLMVPTFVLLLFNLYSVLSLALR